MSESAGTPRTDAAGKRMVEKPAAEAAVEFFGLAMDLERELADCRAELARLRLNYADANEDLVEAESRLASHTEREGAGRCPDTGAPCEIGCRAGWCGRIGETAPSPAGPDALAEEQEHADAVLHAHTEICELFARNSGNYDPTPEEVDIVHDGLTRVLGDLAVRLRSRPAQSRDAERDTARLEWLRKQLCLTIAHALKWPYNPQDLNAFRGAIDRTDAAMSQQDDPSFPMEWNGSPEDKPS